ncbi:hypothetical protein J14TS5_05680 [Paenibacillus lautus]|nr:hypothetical protein J14TS5_05680 [Paenibacillus lautus]
MIFNSLSVGGDANAYILAPLIGGAFFMGFIKRKARIGAQYFEMGSVIKLKAKEKEEMMRT